MDLIEDARTSTRSSRQPALEMAPAADGLVGAAMPLSTALDELCSVLRSSAATVYQHSRLQAFDADHELVQRMKRVRRRSGSPNAHMVGADYSGDPSR